MTLMNPDRNLTVEDLTDDLNRFYDYLQQKIFRKHDLKKPPQHLRPVLLVFYDIEGSKASGRYARYQIAESKYKRYRNLHCHGLLLVHRETLANFESLQLNSYYYYHLDIEKSQHEFPENYIQYMTKLVEQNFLADLDFVHCRVWKSNIRETCNHHNLIETINKEP